MLPTMAEEIRAVSTSSVNCKYLCENSEFLWSYQQKGEVFTYTFTDGSKIEIDPYVYQII
jgi:hypothetical protein